MATPEAPAEVEKQESYGVAHIPEVLYQEFSEQFGYGDEMELKLPYDLYKVKKLDPDKKAAGFAGAIGLSRRENHTILVLWEHIPEEGASTIDADPALELDGGSFQSGVWAAGSGNEMIHSVDVRFPMGVTLYSRAIPLVSSILKRSSDLFNSPNCVKKIWWPGEEPRDVRR